MVTVTNQSAQRKQEQYRAEKKERIETALKVLDQADKIGDGLSIVGTLGAPFADGASLGLTAIGEGISLAATTTTHSIKLSTEGATTENLVDIAVDVAFEVFPGQAENAVERTGLNDVTKKILRAEIKQVSQTAEITTNETIEYCRKKWGII